MINQAIIVAGGKGARFGSVLPKQFLTLRGKPVLLHSIELFEDITDNIVVVLPEEQSDHWALLVKTFPVSNKVIITTGGATRTESVINGLKALPGPSDLIAVHDAVRPLASKGLIEKLFSEAGLYESAIPTIGPRDSLRMHQGTEYVVLDRQKVLAIQTPQVFKSDILKNAYSSLSDHELTDDASAVENAGKKLHFVHGEEWNMKITWPEDIIIAESILKSRENKPS